MIAYIKGLSFSQFASICQKKAVRPGWNPYSGEVKKSITHQLVTFPQIGYIRGHLIQALR